MWTGFWDQGLSSTAPTMQLLGRVMAQASLSGGGGWRGGQGWGPRSWLRECSRGPGSSILTPASPHSGLNGVPGSIWDFVSGSFSPSPSPILNAGPAASSGVSPSSAELARVRRQLDEAKRKIRQWEESWQQVKQVSWRELRSGRAGQGAGPTGWAGQGAEQGVEGRRRLRQVTAAPGFQACDAWQREAKEAKERALAADSARQLALQKKEEVEAQFRRLQEELEGRGLASALPGLRGCGDIGAIPLPKLHSLQSQLRLDLEAVDGVSPALSSRNQRAEHRGGAGGPAQLPFSSPSPPLSHRAPPGRGPRRPRLWVTLQGSWSPSCCSAEPAVLGSAGRPFHTRHFVRARGVRGLPGPASHASHFPVPARTRALAFLAGGCSGAGVHPAQAPPRAACLAPLPSPLWRHRPWEPSPTPEAHGGSSRSLLAPGWPREDSLPQPDGAPCLAHR